MGERPRRVGRRKQEEACAPHLDELALVDPEVIHPHYLPGPQRQHLLYVCLEDGSGSRALHGYRGPILSNESEPTSVGFLR